MQYTLPLPLPAPADPLAECSCDTGGFIGIDANPYCIRLAQCYTDGVVLDTLEAKPQQISRIIHWVRLKKRCFPDLELTGDRRDRWPPGLLPALVQEFGPICWVPDPLLKQTATEFRQTTRSLKFFRAALLAACAQEGHDFFEPSAQTAIQRWKNGMQTEMYFSLNAGPHDDIPF